MSVNIEYDPMSCASCDDGECSGHPYCTECQSFECKHAEDYLDNHYTNASGEWVED